MDDSPAVCPQCHQEVRFRQEASLSVCPACGFGFERQTPPVISSGNPLPDTSVVWQILRGLLIAFLILAVIVLVLIGVLFVGCAVKGFKI